MRFQCLALLVAVSLVACSNDSGGEESAPSPQDEALVAATETYAEIVFATYQDSVDAAEALDDAIGELLADPTAQGLEAARNAWKDAREPYLQSEAFRFYDGPIDDPEHGPEGAINAWPLDEVYLDYVEGDATAGIVNDPDQPLDADALLALNERGGEKNIATGYHAIEFLLWGQDHDDAGPGARPYTDFVDGGTADNQARRRELLGNLSALLVDQLKGLAEAWAEDDPESYRAELFAAEPSEALRRMLTGLIVLSGFETGGERLQTAYDTGDQEDEHSCFSDNTHRDMVQDVRGIRNVWKGRYARLDGSSVSGPSVEDAVALKEQELAEAVSAQIDASLELAEALQPPFDREIALDNPEGRERVLALIDALRDQEDALSEVFEAFDLSVEIPE